MQVSKQGQLGLNVSSGFGVNVIFSVLLLYVLHFVVFRIGALLQECPFACAKLRQKYSLLLPGQ